MLNQNHQLNVCAICREQSKQIVLDEAHQIHYMCSLCGEYYLSPKMIPVLNQRLKGEKRKKLSQWVIDENRAGKIPDLTRDRLKHILFSPTEDLENNWVAKWERQDRERYWLFYVLSPRLGYYVLKFILPAKWANNVVRDGWGANILGFIIWILVIILLHALIKH